MPIAVSVVEDNVPVRELIAEWINLANGFCCISQHGDAESALVDVPVEKPAIVLVDINLPHLSGIEFVRQIKPMLPETQFVMLTVYKDSSHIFDALAAGATGYLLKQTSCKELIASLKQVHEGGSPMTSYIARKVVQTLQERSDQSVRLDVQPGDDLTARERQVLELLTRGYFYKEICETLAISKSTVNTHVRNIYEKLHVHTRGQAIAKYNK